MTPKHVAPRTLLASTIATLAIAGVVAAWLAYSYRQSDAAASAGPAALPQVVVSKPLEREVDSRLGFLGQWGSRRKVGLAASTIDAGQPRRDSHDSCRGRLLIKFRPTAERLLAAPGLPSPAGRENKSR